MSHQESCRADADVYALGALLALLALGHLPFPGDAELLQDNEALQDPESMDDFCRSVLGQVVDPVQVSCLCCQCVMECCLAVYIVQPFVSVHHHQTSAEALIRSHDCMINGQRL